MKIRPSHVYIRCVYVNEFTAAHCNPLQPTATHCNPLQSNTTHCNTLQHLVIPLVCSSELQCVVVFDIHIGLFYMDPFDIGIGLVYKHTHRRQVSCKQVLHRQVRWLRHSVTEFTQETREFYRYRGRVRWLRWVDSAELVVVDFQN